MASVAGMTAVTAQTYPAQPIKVIVGFGPGSAADILARLVGKQMEVSLRQPIVVENRPGNSSMIAADTVARASADGYTLFMATIANTLNPAETKSNQPRKGSCADRPSRHRSQRTRGASVGPGQ
jgi:tripartite-type tricarboxylate transporter receptor subunit TctC